MMLTALTMTVRIDRRSDGLKRRRATGYLTTRCSRTKPKWPWPAESARAMKRRCTSW